jgi:3-hexulose-6-phosphate synthase
MKQVSVLDPDIYVVGRYITQSPSIEKVKEFF